MNRWTDPTVPNKGWTCTDVHDLGQVDAVCEMCGTKEIRYVHYMHHPDYHEGLGCGCICAGKMEGDPEAPRIRETPQI